MWARIFCMAMICMCSCNYVNLNFESVVFRFNGSVFSQSDSVLIDSFSYSRGIVAGEGMRGDSLVYSDSSNYAIVFRAQIREDEARSLVNNSSYRFAFEKEGYEELDTIISGAVIPIYKSGKLLYYGDLPNMYLVKVNVK